MKFDHTQPEGFDVIAMNMAIMDIPDLGPLAGLLAGLLKPQSGRWATAQLHKQTTS